MIGCKDEIVENESVTSGPRTRSESIDEQEICLTPSSTPPEWYFSTRTRSTSDLNEVTLGICVHVIRDSNGYSYGIDKTSVANSIINTLGTYFLGTKINFRFFGSDYIDSDKYNSKDIESSAVRKDLFKSSLNNAINIFVQSSNISSYIGGVADSICSNSLVILRNYYKTPVVAHEVGHCLGLYHTHHGTSKLEKGIAELVDGSNSAYAGDYIVDTPADPCEWSNPRGNCTYKITQKDENGDTYMPSPNNIMSYSSTECLSEFTDGQISMMHHVISKSEILQHTITSIDCDSINGPSHFCSYATYDVYSDFDDVSSYDWTITERTYSGAYSTKTYSGDMLSITNRDSHIYDIYVNIKYKNKLEKTLSRTVTGGAASPNIGLLRWKCHNITDGSTIASIEDNRYLEIENSGKEYTFEAISYEDAASNKITSPIISLDALDLYCSSSNSNIGTFSVRDDIDGEGELYVYVIDECNIEGEPFVIKYIAFDVSTYSMNVSNSVMSVKANEKSRSAEASGKSIKGIKIFTTNMELVMEANYDGSSSAESLNISSLQSGCYYVRIESENCYKYKKLKI
jgi:hypothetical protein